jgi:hypothetical protein
MNFLFILFFFCIEVDRFSDKKKIKKKYKNKLCDTKVTPHTQKIKIKNKKNYYPNFYPLKKI